MVVSVLVLVFVAYLTMRGDLADQSRSLASVASLHASSVSSRPGALNPYSVENSTLVRAPHMLTGYLQASSEKLEDFARFAEESKSTPKASGPWDVDPRLIPTGPNNEIIKRVRFEVGQADYKLAYLFMTDANSERYSPPEDLVRKRGAQGTMRLDMCGFELFTDPFAISFSNTRNPDEKLVHTQDSAFLMMDKYMQLDFQLPSQRIYGLGERVREFTLGEGTWTLWANGQPTPYDDGSGSLQTYGVHPFALIQSASPGEYFGLYFRNSNAQSPVIKHGEGGKATLSYITTGGTLDVYFFFKGTAKQIIQQYQ